MRQIIKPSLRIEGEVTPPGDKSISHRAALLNAIALGKGHIFNFCVGDDRRSILRCLRGLGVQINKSTSCPIAGEEGSGQASW